MPPRIEHNSSAFVAHVLARTMNVQARPVPDRGRPPDNLSMSVIGTIWIPVSGFNSTFESSGHVYQRNKQEVESMSATPIGRSGAAVCTQTIHRSIGNDPRDAFSRGMIAQYVTTTMMAAASALEAAHCIENRPRMASSRAEPMPVPGTTPVHMASRQLAKPLRFGPST